MQSLGLVADSFVRGWIMDPPLHLRKFYVHSKWTKREVYAESGSLYLPLTDRSYCVVTPQCWALSEKRPSYSQSRWALPSSDRGHVRRGYTILFLGTPQWSPEGNFSDVLLRSRMGEVALPGTDRRTPRCVLFYPTDGRLTLTVPEGGQIIWLLHAGHSRSQTPRNVVRWVVTWQISNVLYLDSKQSNALTQRNYGLEPNLYSGGTRPNHGACEECIQTAGWVTPYRNENWRPE